MNGVWQEGRQENDDQDLLRELLHCQCQAQASEAVAYKDHLLIGGNRISQKLYQRLGVVGHCLEVSDGFHVDASSREVDCRDTVVGRFQAWLELVPVYAKNLLSLE